MTSIRLLGAGEPPSWPAASCSRVSRAAAMCGGQHAHAITVTDRATGSHYTLRFMPGVTVIVPARDAERTIGRTLAGLEAQRGAADFEVLVVDDASRDSTAELA